MRDTFGLVPPHIRANAEREELVDKHLQGAVALATALQRLDPRLELWKANDRHPDPPSGVIPGYWHVVRHNDPPAPDSYKPITTPSGGFREPDSGVLHELERDDSWGRHYSLPTDDYDEAQKPILKQRELESEQRKDEIASNYAAAKRTAGDGGLEKRLWAKGKKGIVGT